MALKQQLTTNNYSSIVKYSLGLNENATELYVKIEALTSHSKPSTEYRVEFYQLIDEELMKTDFKEFRFTIDLLIDDSEGDFNPWKQGYEYLKTLPRFADFEDC